VGLYNFQSQFVPFILDGRKTHTIRATRKNPDKPGNTMHLYTGLRQKGARLLMRVPCVKVERIRIFYGHSGSKSFHMIELDGNVLDNSECELLAQRDGFRSFAEMMYFWHDRLPFEGHVIHWKGKR
jgi:hypothetical protein